MMLVDIGQGPERSENNDYRTLDNQASVDVTTDDNTTMAPARPRCTKEFLLIKPYFFM